jgi:hypothetical protein
MLAAFGARVRTATALHAYGPVGVTTQTNGTEFADLGNAFNTPESADIIRHRSIPEDHTALRQDLT